MPMTTAHHEHLPGLRATLPPFYAQEFATTEQRSATQPAALAELTEIDLGDLRPVRVASSMRRLFGRAASHVVTVDAVDVAGVSRIENYLTLYRSTEAGNEVPDAILCISDGGGADVKFSAVTGLGSTARGEEDPRRVVAVYPDVRRTYGMPGNQKNVVETGRVESPDPRMPRSRAILDDTEASRIVDDVVATMESEDLLLGSGMPADMRDQTLELAQQIGLAPIATVAAAVAISAA